jgi:hypothetical protein
MWFCDDGNIFFELWMKWCFTTSFTICNKCAQSHLIALLVKHDQLQKPRELWIKLWLTIHWHLSFFFFRKNVFQEFLTWLITNFQCTWSSPMEIPNLSCHYALIPNFQISEKNSVSSKTIFQTWRAFFSGNEKKTINFLCYHYGISKLPTHNIRCCQ